MEISEILLNILTAGFAGFSSGMFGIAGSVVASPILSLALNYSPMIALATPLPSAIPSAVSGSYLYNKQKLIHYKLSAYALIGAIPFSFAGSFATAYIEGNSLMIAKAAFLILLGINFLLTGKLLKKSDGQSKESITASIMAGSLAGFVAGILAVGGGIVLVTAFVRINKLSIKEAIATSLLCVGVLSIINSAVHYHLNHIAFYPALIIFLSVAPFSYLGAKLAVKLKNSTMERLFGTMLIVFAIYFIIVRTCL